MLIDSKRQYMKTVPEQTVQARRACRSIRGFAIWLLVLCFFIQLLIKTNIINLISNFIVLITSAITFHFVIRANVIAKAPLPALCILCFNFATMSGALIAQTLSWRPLIFNLEVPLITFVACSLFQISLFASLLLFLTLPVFRSFSRKVNERLLKPMGLMDAPSSIQLWLMGILGSCIMFWTATVIYSNTGVQYGDVKSKLLFALTYLAYAPFIIPILNIFFPDASRYKPKRRSKEVKILIIYFIAQVVFAVGRNSRAAFAMGVSSLGLAFLLSVLLGQMVIEKKISRRIVVSVAMLLMLAPFFIDLATAMVVVRSMRGKIPTTELIKNTFLVAIDRETVGKFRQEYEISSGSGEYEEYYLRNPFLARLINTKFVDNTLALKGVRNGRYSDYLWDVTIKKLKALLPTPAIKMLGLKLNKEDIAFSMGYAMQHIEYGGFFGVYTLGSEIGHGIGLMGPVMFVVVIPLFLVVFIALQSLTTTIGGFVVITPVILLQLMRVYYLACNDSLLTPVSFILRGLPQDILLYWLVFKATRWLSVHKKIMIK